MRHMPKGGNTRKQVVAEIAAQLHWGEKTIQEIMEATGSPESTIRGWLESFRESGLVRLSEKKSRKGSGRKASVWQWQPTPFKLEDMHP